MLLASQACETCTGLSFLTFALSLQALCEYPPHPNGAKDPRQDGLRGVDAHHCATAAEWQRMFGALLVKYGFKGGIQEAKQSGLFGLGLDIVPWGAHALVPSRQCFLGSRCESSYYCVMSACLCALARASHQIRKDSLHAGTFAAHEPDNHPIMCL